MMCWKHKQAEFFTIVITFSYSSCIEIVIKYYLKQKFND